VYLHGSDWAESGIGHITPIESVARSPSVINKIDEEDGGVCISMAVTGQRVG